MDHNLHFPDFDEIKAHFRKNKKFYLGFGVGAAAGITLVVLRGQYPASASLVLRPIYLFSNHNKMEVIAVIAREGRGHPGYLVRCKETGDIFLTQGGAALWAGVSPQSMTRHLNGQFPNLDGLHFERLGALPAVPA